MAKRGDQLGVLPRAVRNHEIEQSSFLARSLSLAEFTRTTSEFEELDPLVKIGLVGVLVFLDG